MSPPSGSARVALLTRTRALSRALTFTLVGTIAIGGCGGNNNEAGRSTTVVASFYPLAFAAERVGGVRVTVKNLTPPGAEPHDLELSPKQIDAISDADAVIVLGGGFQPAIDTAAQQRDEGLLEVLDAIPSPGAGRGAGAGAENAADDPHVWLDPVVMKSVVGEVAKTLTAVDAAGSADYRANAETLTIELDALHAQMTSGLARCTRKEFVTSHGAFGHLAARYGLTAEGVAGLSPGAEPSPSRLAALVDLVQRTGATTIFSEALMPADLAETIARETGARTDVLDPLEGLDDEQIAEGADYFTVMRSNLAKLQAALGCE